MTMDHDGPDYGEPHRDARTAMVHRDARRDDSGMTGSSSSRAPLPAQVGAYRPRGPQNRGEVVFIREIPESLYTMIRDRLSAKQDLDLDGDLASTLSQSAVVTAWLMATLHTRPAVFRSNPHINRAADLLEDGLQNAGITTRMGELSTGMTRAVRRLERMETLLTSDHATLKAVEAVIDFLTTWQVKPSQANNDRVVDRIDVTWPEAVRTGLRVRRDLDLPLDDEDRPIRDRYTVEPQSREDVMEDDEEPSGPHVRLPGTRRVRRRDQRAITSDEHQEDIRIVDESTADDPSEDTEPSVSDEPVEDATVTADTPDEESAEAVETDTPEDTDEVDAGDEPASDDLDGSDASESDEPDEVEPDESNEPDESGEAEEPEEPEESEESEEPDESESEESDDQAPEPSKNAGADDPLAHVDILPDSSSLTDWLNNMDESEE